MLTQVILLKLGGATINTQIKGGLDGKKASNRRRDKRVIGVNLIKIHQIYV